MVKLDTIMLKFNKDEFDEFVVLIHNKSLVNDIIKEQLLDMIGRDIKHKIVDMHDTIYLRLELHPSLFNLLNWILLSRGHWVQSIS